MRNTQHNSKWIVKIGIIISIVLAALSGVITTTESLALQRNLLPICQAFYVSSSPRRYRTTIEHPDSLQRRSFLNFKKTSSHNSSNRRIGLQSPLTKNDIHYYTTSNRAPQEQTSLPNNQMSSCRLQMSSTELLVGEMTNPTLFSSIRQIISIFSKSTLQAPSASTALVSITDALSTTPPIVYFLCLMAAGFGVPVSEDAMCIFAGTILPSIWTVDPVKRNRLLLALYSGVVLSDIVTFSIGRALKMGVMEPIRKRMNLQTDRVEFCAEDFDGKSEKYEAGRKDMDADVEERNCQIATPKLKKRDRVLKKLETAGDYAGLVIRFSVGFRAPMMLFAGLSGKVPVLKYIIGTCVGALGSLSLQLLVGYTMRYNPAAVVGIVASISTFVALVPISIGLITSVSIMWQKYQIRRNMNI